MKHLQLENMKNGWFVGNFLPTVLATEQFEVAIKHYPAGSEEAWHYHAIATEVTVVVSGHVEMCGKHFKKGDIIVLEPGEGTSFKAKTETTCTVVKIPSVANDKFFKSKST